MVFGEIDSRIHIYYQYMKRGRVVSIPQLIDETVRKYGDILKLLDSVGLSFFVYGIPPASKEENIYHYPFYANKETRIMISRELNESLKKFCLQNSYQYLDIQSKFADASGLISEEFAADNVHLNQRAAATVAEELRIKAGSLNGRKSSQEVQIVRSRV